MSDLRHNLSLRRILKERRMKQIFRAPTIADDELGRFIDWGEPNCRRGPGDKTNASYAFDLYDFARGRYRYDI